MFLAIVPAFNEEKNIGSVVRDLFNHGGVDKVVVIDDGSVDNTAGEAEKAGAEVLKHSLNCGQGMALQTGHEYAKMMGADYIVHFDADGQFLSTEIAEAWQYLKNSKANILFGSRFLNKKSQIPFFKRVVLIPLGRLVNRFWGAIPLTDPQAGFRILDKRAIEKIQIDQPRMAHATEILIKTKKYNLQYVEYPVYVIYHRFGQNFSGGLKIIKDLLLGKFVK
ncbi:MAG: Glycosyl transferase, family 2 [Candidatus Magasanikbacteria bacterium GW2011_GWC2_37_14]|uniref:Glycosyl transferase, family 2 n=1 Tax=Candidatus Magasanikbacteria bacterium GW2011_GWC2_37_14 TaxID=1619046 RepID=A0A0G0IUA1_9BACT|nr:MAG: Glycosyl transferase, family 2 [Candidatus Magasanikbacteria bacterium GW2011_GWC2_37_14]